MEGSAGWSASRNSDGFGRNFLDIEEVALQYIVSLLDNEDRRNVALTCKTLCEIVRSQWRLILVNVFGSDPVPPGIARFRSLEAVVWTDVVNLPSNAAFAESDWDANADFEIPDSDHVPSLTTAQIRRLKQANDYVSQAIGDPRPATVADVERFSGDASDAATREFHQGLMRLMKPVADYVRDSTRHMRNTVYEDQSLADAFAGLGAGGIDDIDLAELGMQDDDGDDDDDDELPDVFAPAPDSNDGDDDFDDHLNGRAAAATAAAASGPSTSTHQQQIINTTTTTSTENQNQQRRRLRLIIATPLFLSGLDLQTLFFHSRPCIQPDYSGLPATSRFGALMDGVKAAAYPLRLPFTDIDIGWWESDGHLPANVTRGTAAWCYHSPTFVVNDDVDGTTTNTQTQNQFPALRALRICVRDCELEAEEISDAFVEHVVPYLKVNYLPALRELHLGRPLSFGQQLELDPRRLDLPHLTRLVLNEMVSFGEFAHFTHLTSLQSLAVAMPAAGFEAQPQDLSSLASLRDLRSLRVEYWQVEDPQDVALLQHLTELELEGMEGRVHLTKPAHPMPNLAGVTLTRLPHHQDMRYREDSKFARWCLRHAAELFPSVEVLHLGTLGSAPAKVNNEVELRRAAEVVDAHVVPLLATRMGVRTLQYVQLDTVLNIEDDALDKRCETGSVVLTALLDIPLDAVVNGGGVNGSNTTTIAAQRVQSPPTASASTSAAAVPADLDEEEDEELDIITSPSELTSPSKIQNSSSSQQHQQHQHRQQQQNVVRWERTVEFQVCQPTDVLVAEFHYSRTTPLIPGDDGDDECVE